MADLFHWYGQDLSADSSGDLMTVEGTVKGQQFVIRRLLTVPLTYIWDIIFGGGLSTYIGTPTGAATIDGVIRTQLFLEPAVSQTPIPVITVTPISSGLNVVIQYVDDDTGAPAVLNFNVVP